MVVKSKKRSKKALNEKKMGKLVRVANATFLVVEVDVNIAAVLKAAAAAGRLAVIVADVRVATLATGLTVLEIVRVFGAATVAVLALEDAAVHVGGAAAASVDLHAVAAHVGLTRDVNGGVVAGGELAPGVVDLPVAEDGDAVVEGGKGARDAVGDRDGDGVAGVLEGVGNVRLADVDEAGLVVVGLGVPDDDGDGGVAALGGAVGEVELVGAVVADPDQAVVATVVFALGAKANVGHVLAVGAVETPDGVAAVEATLGNGGQVVFTDCVSGCKPKAIG